MRHSFVVLQLLGVLGLGVFAAKPAAPVPVTVTLGAGSLTEDGLGPYQHGTECVGSTYTTPGGDYSFRTASHTVGTCEADGGPWTRTVSLDLSLQTVASTIVDCAHDVKPEYPGWDVCGSNNLIEDARLSASGLFAAGSTSSSVTVYFSRHPELNNTEFVLTYRQPLSVSGTYPLRILGPGPAGLADLHRAVPKLNRKGQVVGYSLDWLGIWNVPFTLTSVPPS
jgi:hypothetical protein